MTSNIQDIEFMQSFMRTTLDAYVKGWHERNGGNLTYRLTPNEVEEAKQFFNEGGELKPIGGVNVKNLAGEYFLVTGSGKYFRNVTLNPVDNAGIIKIDESGDNYQVLWGLEHGARPTSELASHLMNHSVKFDVTNGLHRVILHSHATNVIALTFVLPLRSDVFTRELWEMATECPVVFPNGVGIVEWMVPGGAEIAKATSKLMKKFNVVVWAHHGVFCSEATLDLAFGLMDTVEKSAEILVKVKSMGGKNHTITTDNFIELAKAFNIEINKDALRQK